MRRQLVTPEGHMCAQRHEHLGKEHVVDLLVVPAVEKTDLHHLGWHQIMQDDGQLKLPQLAEL